MERGRRRIKLVKGDGMLWHLGFSFTTLIISLLEICFFLDKGPLITELSEWESHSGVHVLCAVNQLAQVYFSSLANKIFMFIRIQELGILKFGTVLRGCFFNAPQAFSPAWNCLQPFTL